MSHAVVLLDREQGGRGNIEKEGVAVIGVMTLTQLIKYLKDADKITMETVSMVKAFIADSGSLPLPNPQVLQTPLTSQTPPASTVTFILFLSYLGYL